MQQTIYVLLTLSACVSIFFIVKKKSERETIKTMELMKKFTEEMVLENQKFLQHFGDLNIKLEAKMKILEQKFGTLEQKMLSVEAAVDSADSMREDYPVQQERRADLQVVSRDILHLHERYQEVFLLYNQGVGVEEICRNLNVGKGELALILQLAGEK